MTRVESWTSLSSYFHCQRDSALVVGDPVEVGDVLVVRGQRVEVEAVFGEGPFTVPVGAVRLSEHLPIGEPVRVFRPSEGGRR